MTGLTDTVERHVEGAQLLMCYGALLTDGQREIMSLHYNEDLSLQEIADQQGISRQGVHDILNRSLKKLERYEACLGMVHRSEERLSALSDCRIWASGLPDSPEARALRETLGRLIQEEEQT